MKIKLFVKSDVAKIGKPFRGLYKKQGGCIRAAFSKDFFGYQGEEDRCEKKKRGEQREDGCKQEIKKNI